ncbi:glycosyltransferase family 25 protein [Xylariaceae sp. FL0662B]|nr:glycosyltransferase family 25 protein [Xylariaceae sp. FL0662B]
MIAGRPRRTGISSLVLATVCICILVVYLGYGSVENQAGSTARSTRWMSWAGTDAKSDIFNSTLGFEKVFAIGLPERTDKRDALSLMASLTGFKLTWVDGVAGKTIPDKALPFGWDREKLPDSNLGSWRGHIDAIRQIVDNGLSSALIMEDDMDWDVHIKTLLSQFATAAGQIQKGFHRNQTLSSPSPYGQDWDMLWVGSCLTTFDEDLSENLQIPPEKRDPRKVLIQDDPTVPSANHILGNGGFSWDSYPPNTRIVYVPGDNVCSFAYALSAAGAQKALQYLSIEGQHKPYDNHLSDICRLRENGMRCVSIVPSLFVHHKPRGKISGDSDINNGGENGEIREVGFTENVLYSTHLNMKNLVRGIKPERQWAD